MYICAYGFSNRLMTFNFNDTKLVGTQVPPDIDPNVTLSRR